MPSESINTLLDALALSPDNVPLRLHVAELMVQEGLYEEASQQYQQILDKSYGNAKAQLGLARCYFELSKFSAATIIYEHFGDELPLTDTVLYIKCLIKEGAMQQAISLYQKLLAFNPGFKDAEIDSHLRMPK